MGESAWQRATKKASGESLLASAQADGKTPSHDSQVPTPVQTRTHEQIVRSRLGWIVAGVWVVAGSLILNMVVGFFASVATANSGLS